MSSPRVGEGDGRVRGDSGRVELSSPWAGFSSPRAGLRCGRVVWNVDGLGVRRWLDGRLAQVLEGDAGRDGLSGRGNLGERVGFLVLRARDMEELTALEGYGQLLGEEAVACHVGVAGVLFARALLHHQV